MHKKRLLIILLTTLVSTFLMGSVPAGGFAQIKPDPPLPIRAVIVNNETKESHKLPIVMDSIKALGQNRFAAQYSVKIPEVILRGGHYVPYPDYDPTYSAKIVIWVNYFFSYIRGVPYMKVYLYDGQWIRLDPSVRCTKLTVTARVYGELLSTGRQISGSPSYTRYNPKNGALYRIIPRWSGEFVQINDGYYQGGFTLVTLKRGTSTWTGSVSVFNPGGPY